MIDLSFFLRFVGVTLLVIAFWVFGIGRQLDGDPTTHEWMLFNAILPTAIAGVGLGLLFNRRRKPPPHA